MKNALRIALLGSVAATSFAVPHFASAQDVSVEEIVVTGSRIRGANMETQQPILTLNREALEQQGFTSVADVLQNLTSAGSPAICNSSCTESKRIGMLL